jgi:hypothetical protein
MKKQYIFFLALTVLTSVLLGFFCLTRGHNWWDDFASYIMQAQSILNGTMDDFIIHNTFTVETSSFPPGPAAYAWGYPLLIIPVYTIFGINPLAIKLIGVGFYALFLVVFFFLSRRRLNDRYALALTLAFAFNPAILSGLDLILADFPFLAVSTLNILLIEIYLGPIEPISGKHDINRTSILMGLLLGATMFWAAFLRTNGILAPLPFVIALYIQHQNDWKKIASRAWFPGLTFIVLYIVSKIIFPGGQTSYFSHFYMFTIPHFFENIRYYLWLPATMFDGIPGGVIIYPTLALFMILGIRRHWKRDLHIHAYSLATISIFIIWPERQGLRFLYPLLPFLLILACEEMLALVARVPTKWQSVWKYCLVAFWIWIIASSLVVSSRAAYVNMAAGRAINGPFDSYSYQMYEFIREKTDADSVVIFFKPRTLRLFTGRDSFMTERCEDLSKGDYIVIHEKQEDNGQIDPAVLPTCNPDVSLERIFTNKRYTIYKIEK